MSKKPNKKLRGPQPEPNDHRALMKEKDWTTGLDTRFARFLSHNVRPPAHPETLASVPDDIESYENLTLVSAVIRPCDA